MARTELTCNFAVKQKIFRILNNVPQKGIIIRVFMSEGLYYNGKLSDAGLVEQHTKLEILWEGYKFMETYHIPTDIKLYEDLADAQQDAINTVLSAVKGA